MNKNSLNEYPLYLAAKFLAVFFRALPFALSFFIGRRLGSLGPYINRKRWRIAYANIKCALGNKYSPQQLKKISKQTYKHMGQGIIEILLLPKMDKAYVERNFEFEGFENMDNALKLGKGAIFLTAHFGSWEVAASALPINGYVFKGIAREQKPYLINNMLNSFREAHGCKMISKGMPIREILKALRNNEIVGMLVDQDAGKTGILTDLFNKPASWNRGVMQFALRTGCKILPGFAHKKGGAKIKFVTHKPIVFPEHGTEEDKIKEGFRQYAAILEESIRKSPDQWLWQHRRWKSSPQRRILILNDGKTGHLRQSQATLLQLKKLYKERGLSSEDIITETTDIKFKNTFAKNILYFGSHFLCAFYRGPMRCLRACLNEEIYRRLVKTYADVIISCGGKLAAVNILFSKECNARSVVVMNPGGFLINKFNLAIIPRHDSPKKNKNVVITSGAPNLIDKTLIEYQADKLKYETGNMRKRKIGLLLGGNYKKFSMSEDIIAKLIDQINMASERIDADILITTSRRTPKEAEILLKQKFSRNPRSKLLIIASENNKEGVVGGILGLCDITIVSPESVSMISEAASSGSYVFVFDAETIPDKRHKLFLKNLADNGYIKLVDIDTISEQIDKFFKERPEVKALNDNEVIKKGLERIV